MLDGVSKPSLEIQACKLTGGRPRGRELLLYLKRLCVDHETFEWLGGGVSSERLVLDLKPD